MADPTIRHIVALSGGKDSTAMALRLAETKPDTEFEFICTPTGDELPEMFDHWKLLTRLLGRPLTFITHKSMDGEIKRQKCLPNSRMRWCTRELKLKPYHQFMAAAIPCVSYVGIRADEDIREGVDHEAAVDGVVSRYPLVEWGWGINEVLVYLHEIGVRVPDRTDCGRCFWQTLGEWWRLWRDHPDRFQKYVESEQEMGYTYRNDSRDTWPAALEELGAMFEQGHKPPGADTPRNANHQMSLIWGVQSRRKMCGWCAR